ncbi:hypothetical protein [uncultured Aquimarina sp.]|uniref:hypothetical protein n=1 Tax=uncultured Aquimarina sp. TaxID=575652 RepID=UPI00261FBE21|nr:hypothetical protein [uncultured Aquimarina sp.]
MKKIILSIVLIFGIILTSKAQDEIVNGNLKIEGNIDATGSNRRLHLGGVGNSTFGISFSSQYPNYGIFYTEGSPDFVSISPNGNSKNGVINVFGNGNVGIGTITPKSRLDIGTNYSDPSVYPNKITLWSGGQNNYFGFGISNGDLDYFSQSNHRFYTEYNGTPGSEKMVIESNGNVGIGTSNPNGWKLAVNGKIRAKEIKVETDWSDFVFYANYKLPTLLEVENHIKENGHLKDIPSAKEVAENGIFLGEMDSKLLQKIEELTLYTIQQQKEIEKLKLQNKKLLELQSRLEKLESEK